MEGSTVTVEQLKLKCERAFDLRSEVDMKKAELSAIQKDLDEIENEIVAVLEELGLKSFKSSTGTVETRVRQSVKVPQGDGRVEFFNYLKERGLFDSLITVNSQTLNAWYKQEAEVAQEEKRMLVIPGLEMPTSNVSVVLKRNR